jgi:hypothetical protein
MGFVDLFIAFEEAEQLHIDEVLPKVAWSLQQLV